jgi:predicted RNA-binding protein with PUA-like domain
MKNHWIVKSEPAVYSIDDLKRDGSTHWDGVRNFQARNFMRDRMRLDDLVLFYHSNSSPPEVVGLARVSREGYPDHTAYDPHDLHFDPKATPENPIWSMVEITFVEKFEHAISLAQLRDDPALDGLLLTQRGSRLSVMPLLEAHFHRIISLTSHEENA